MSPDELLTPEEVSEWLDLSTGALAQLRYKKEGPPFLRLTPRSVRYRRSSVESWLISLDEHGAVSNGGLHA